MVTKPDWKPIETAPSPYSTNNGDVLLWDGCGKIGYRFEGQWHVSVGETEMGPVINPTHWAELPLGPNDNG